MSLYEVVAAVVLLGTTGVGVFAGMSAVWHGGTVVAQESAATNLLGAEVEALTTDPYTPYPTTAGYPTSGAAVPNPDHLPVSLEVENYEAGATPDFSPQYPDSGLQEVRVVVTLQDGRTYTATTYKSR